MRDFHAKLRLLCLLFFKYLFATRMVLKIGEYFTIHRGGGKYPSLSTTLRWIIVLVYTTQAE